MYIWDEPLASGGSEEPLNDDMSFSVVDFNWPGLPLYKTPCNDGYEGNRYDTFPLRTTGFLRNLALLAP